MKVNDELIEVGDCVSVSSEDPTTALYLARYCSPIFNVRLKSRRPQ